MVTTLFDLPPEIREHVFSYCKISDIMNLVCCNSIYYTEINYWLFSHLRIDLTDLENTVDAAVALETKLKYLKFTKMIRFHGSLLVSDRSSPAWYKMSKNCTKLLSHCENLKQLELRSTSGTVVKRILRKTTNLTHLLLSSSSSLHIPCWKEVLNLSSLDRLALYACQLSDDAFKVISKHRQIQTLSMICCSGFTRDGIGYLGEMSQLKKLMMTSGDKLDIDIFWVKKLTKLLHLHLLFFMGKESSLDAGMAEVFSTAIQLKTLMISGSYVGDDAFSAITSQVLLSKLNLSYNKDISDLTLARICRVTSLTELYLDECDKITDVGIQKLKSLASLRVLHVNECTLLTDNFLNNLQIPALKELSLNGCTKVTDEGMSHLKMLVLLVKLDVLDIRLCDVGLMYISVLKLKQLQISTTLISKDGINEFCEKSNMKVLATKGNDLTFINSF